MRDSVLSLLEGAYDVHLHAAPCIQARRRTIYQTAQDFKQAGMAGFVVKDHNFPTSQLSGLMAEVEPAVKVIGGITLNNSVGGMNPKAVEASFRLGGKVVWMPSLESEWMLCRIQQPDFRSAKNYRGLGVGGGFQGYSVFHPGTEKLTDEAKEILRLCKEYNGVFETSHCSKRETYALLRQAKDIGVKHFVVTHANTDLIPYTAQEQRELAEMGAVIQLCMATYMSKPDEPGLDIRELAAFVRDVGVEHLVLCTDFGLNIWPPAVEGMRMMAAALLSMEISEEEIRRMVRDNAQAHYAG